jgi:transposase
MPRPYSLDLRERVIARIEAGETRTAAAAHFAVSAPSAIRWAQLKRDTGGVAPKPAGGTRPLSLAPQRDWLLARIAQKPDLTLRAIQAELNAMAIPASYGAVQRFFKAERISFKKKPARKRAGPA